MGGKKKNTIGSSMSNLRNNSSPTLRRQILHMVNFLGLVVLWSIGSLSTTAIAQQTTGSASSPVAYASVTELNSILAQVKQTSTAIEADLEKTRIEKWQTRREA